MDLHDGQPAAREGTRGEPRPSRLVSPRVNLPRQFARELQFAYPDEFHYFERDPETGLLVGYVPGWPGAHTQGADLDELQRNLREVIELLLEDGEPELQSEFVDVRTIQVA